MCVMEGAFFPLGVGVWLLEDLHKQEGKHWI
jgi:hypothetical protein